MKHFFQEQSKLLICQDPHPEDTTEVHRIVFIDALEKLCVGEFSCFFGSSHKTRFFCGDLFLKLGDDIGQRDSLQLLGPGSSFSSRYFEDLAAVDFHKVINPLKRKPRSVSEHRKIVDAVQANKTVRGMKTKAHEMAQKAGLTMTRSPLWDIPVFSEDIFFRHTNCILHLENEGLLRWWLGNIGVKLGKPTCVQLNKKALELTTSRALLPITKVFFNFDLNFTILTKLREFSSLIPKTEK